MSEPSSRRDFLLLAAGAAVVSGCGDGESVNADPQGFDPGARLPTKPASGEDAAACSGDTSAFAIGPAAQDVPLNQPMKVNYPAIPNLYVCRDSQGLVGLDITCTHRGCRPDFVPDYGIWMCPCHGSQYGLTGNLLKGPAPLPMKKYAACKGSDGFVRIDVSKPVS